MAGLTALIAPLIPELLPKKVRCLFQNRYYDEEYQVCKPKLPVFKENNGCKHYYELVQEDISWTEAKSRANNKNHRIIPGHLATITSHKEQQFIEKSENLRQLLTNSDGEEVFVRGHFSYQLSVISYQYPCNKEACNMEYSIFSWSIRYGEVSSPSKDRFLSP